MLESFGEGIFFFPLLHSLNSKLQARHDCYCHPRLERTTVATRTPLPATLRLSNDVLPRRHRTKQKLSRTQQPPCGNSADSFSDLLEIIHLPKRGLRRAGRPTRLSAPEKVRRAIRRRHDPPTQHSKTRAAGSAGLRAGAVSPAAAGRLDPPCAGAPPRPPSESLRTGSSPSSACLASTWRGTRNPPSTSLPRRGGRRVHVSPRSFRDAINA